MVKVKKKILIVGGTGFIGYHLALYGLNNGYKVFSLSKNRPSKKRYLPNVNYIFTDILDKNKLLKIKDRFDYIINASGYGRHLNFNNNGYNLFKSHYFGIMNLVEFSKKKKIKKFIHLGSSFEYGQSKKKIKENYTTLPTSIYGVAKLACTNYLIKNKIFLKFPFTVFRLFQVYGPTQNENRLIPYLINNCKKNKKIYVTHGSQMRNFCYVEDIAKAVFLSLSNKKTNGKIFNLASSENFKIFQIVKMIKNLIGKGKIFYGTKPMHLGETPVLKPDISRLKYHLKWRPTFKLSQGLDMLINNRR